MAASSLPREVYLAAISGATSASGECVVTRWLEEGGDVDARCEERKGRTRVVYGP